MNRQNSSASILNKKLAGYTLLGAAAVTVSGKAHADTMTYVNVNQTFTQNTTTTYNFNFTGPSSGEIQIIAKDGGAYAYPVATDSSIIISGTDPDAAALLYGAAIDPNGGNWSPSGTQYKMTSETTSVKGPWPSNGSSAYLGFYFTDTDGIHAGWANISTTASTSGGSFTINNYAYDNTAGEAITAGQGAPSAVTPEPSTLSLLMLGSAGLLEARRRRKVN